MAKVNSYASFLQKLYLTEKISFYNEYCMMWLMIKFYFKYKKEKVAAFKNERNLQTKESFLKSHVWHRSDKLINTSNLSKQKMFRIPNPPKNEDCTKDTFVYNVKSPS